MIPEKFEEFEASLKDKTPPSNWPVALKSLWYDAKGDWEGSHNIAQDMHNTMGSWIHAYLHRKEGDEWNAGYWYRQAGRPFSKLSFEEELKEIVIFVLKK